MAVPAATMMTVPQLRSWLYLQLRWWLYRPLRWWLYLKLRWWLYHNYADVCTSTTLMAVPAATMMTVPQLRWWLYLQLRRWQYHNYADGCTSSYNDDCTDNYADGCTCGYDYSCTEQTGYLQRWSSLKSQVNIWINRLTLVYGHLQLANQWTGSALT
jgi:hypothetical protein